MQADGCGLLLVLLLVSQRAQHLRLRGHRGQNGLLLLLLLLLCCRLFPQAVCSCRVAAAALRGCAA
jgi:hypothetical protein